MLDDAELHDLAAMVVAEHEVTVTLEEFLDDLDVLLARAEDVKALREAKGRDLSPAHRLRLQQMHTRLTEARNLLRGDGEPSCSAS